MKIPKIKKLKEYTDNELEEIYQLGVTETKEWNSLLDKIANEQFKRKEL